MDELNKYLHEQIMGEKCWHEPTIAETSSRGTFWKCDVCREPLGWGGKPKNPDYCNSLDAVSRVEAKVIERVSSQVYGINVMQIGYRDFDAFRSHTGSEKTTLMVTLTARQRAEACKSAWESAA